MYWDVIPWILDCILVPLGSECNHCNVSYAPKQRESVWRDVAGAWGGSDEEKAHSRLTPSSSTGFQGKCCLIINQQKFAWIYRLFKYYFNFSTAFSFWLLVSLFGEGIFSWKHCAYYVHGGMIFFFLVALFLDAYNY